MSTRPTARLATLACLAACALAQDPAPQGGQVFAPGHPVPLEYWVQHPADFAPEQYRPVVLLLAQSSAGFTQAHQLARGLAQRGMVVAWPHPWLARRAAGEAPGVLPHPALAQLPARLRERLRIDQGGLHLVAIGDAVAPACAFASRNAWQFQSLSLFGGEPAVAGDAAVSLRGRRIVWFAPAGAVEGEGAQQPTDPAIVRRDAVPEDRLAEAIPAHLAELHAARELRGPGGEVARALDDLHDAAAKGDEDRYFALLPDDAVFLGTDGTERWTGTEFRAFAMPYFQRPSAWIYVPRSRHVDVAADGAFAWFDEVLDNESYGECRGSGVLARRDGRWVVRQYNLTIPVPNELASGLVARIRAFAAGQDPALATIVVVRHAEKGDGDDPDLSEAGRARAARLAALLRDLPVVAVFATEFRRTQQTVAPFCKAHGLQAEVVPARDTQALVQRIRETGVRAAVLVAAHSNTIPALLQRLDVPGTVAIGDDEYDDVFVVTRTADGAHLLRLHY